MAALIGATVVLPLLASAAPTKTHTSSIIRFLDTKGVERVGCYEGRNRARLLGASSANELAAQGPWPLSDQVVDIRRLLAPAPQPPAIFAIGLNYWGHINATGQSPSQTPSLFFKNLHAYNHPLAPVVIPPSIAAPNGTSWASRPDYEGELGVILSKDCKDVSAADALDCVQGYTVCHDVSMRCFQNPEGGACPGNGGQYSFSKGLDTHAPIGPALVSPAALGDGSGLRMTTRVNGELRQNVSTSELIYGVRAIISFISQGTTLPKGSLLCTGTPDGVGDTQKPAKFLADGDSVAVAIEKIGTLTNPIVFGKDDGRAWGEDAQLDQYLSDAMC